MVGLLPQKSRVGKLIKTKRGSYVLRRVIWIQPSEELTQRGNPDGYWFIVECGHLSHGYHCARTVITALQVRLANEHEKLKDGGTMPYPLVGCHECARTPVPSLTIHTKWVLGRLPEFAFKQVPELQALWDRVKDFKEEEKS